jgi:hypothetical protein
MKLDKEVVNRRIGLLEDEGVRFFTESDICLKESLRNKVLEEYDANRIVQIIEFAVRNAVYEGRDEIILTDVLEGGKNCKALSTAGGFGFNGGNNNA